MPVRQRLAESLFTVASIRSEAGRAVLEDLITLYRSEFEVEHRPGLRPKQCHCLDQKGVRVTFGRFPRVLLTLVCEQGSGTRTLETHLRPPQSTPHIEAQRPLLLSFRRVLLLVHRRPVVHQPRQLE
jgi:hypothetical protein